MVFRAILRRTGSRGKAVFALLLGLLVLSVSCSNSGFLYVSSSDRNAYFKVPATWKYFDKRDILVASGQSLSAETNRQLPWLIAFDSDPEPSLDHVLSLGDAPKYPVVEARIQKLTFQVRDQLSLAGIRNAIYPVDQLVQVNAAEVLNYTDVTLPGGLHGNRITYDVIPNGVTGISSGGSVIRVEQMGVVDPSTNTLYVFVVRCESHCFQANKSLIDQIAESWTVKAR
jgi:hypothetical protein